MWMYVLITLSHIHIYTGILLKSLTKKQSIYYIFCIFSGGLDSKTTCNLSGIVETKMPENGLVNTSSRLYYGNRETFYD